MVDIDPKDWDDMRKDRQTVVHLRRKPVDPELNELDKQMVNPSARITVPLTHSRQLRRIADQLRALAGKLESISADTESRERTLLFEAWWEIRRADRRLKYLGKGLNQEGKEY